MQKRQSDDLIGSDNGTSKRTKVDDDDVPTNTMELVSSVSSSLIVKSDSKFLGPNRTSKLFAPTMQLSGHSGAVYSLSFSPTGDNLASAGVDGNILLWDVYGECKNYNVLTGHKNAVLELKWTNENRIISASADKTVALWDANSGRRLRKLTEHTGIVNTCATARDAASIYGSGSDDCTAIMWDTRQKTSAGTLYHDYQVLALALAADGIAAYTGGIDNIIRKWDLRSDSEPVETLTLRQHADSITGLAVSPDGNHLLSNSMDNTVCKWDLRPFPANPDSRCELVFYGSTHGAEKCLLRCGWSPDQERIVCGSADRNVRIWEASSGRVLYVLPGHKGSVNDAVFHPTEPIVASCSTDHEIFLGELL